MGIWVAAMQRSSGPRWRRGREPPASREAAPLGRRLRPARDRPMILVIRRTLLRSLRQTRLARRVPGPVLGRNAPSRSPRRRLVPRGAARPFAPKTIASVTRPPAANASELRDLGVGPVVVLRAPDVQPVAAERGDTRSPGEQR